MVAMMDYQENLNPPENPKSSLRWGRIILFIFLFIILLVIIVFIWRVVSTALKIRRGEIVVNENVNTNVQVDKDNDPYTGSLSAPVEIIAFEDFQCPVCKEVFPIVKEIISTYGDRILFVYRDFPITDSHPQAQKSHEAAECADDQGKFWEYHDKLYINQENLDLDSLKRYAEELNLNTIIFNNCLDSGKYQKEVEFDYLDGIKAGVDGTPTWFINKIKYEGAIPLDIFKKIIDAELKKTQ